MRWHIELNEQGHSTFTEHAETLEIARQTADEILRGAAQKMGLSEELVSRIHGKLTQEDFGEPAPGDEWSYELGDGAHAHLLVGALAPGDRDDECDFCAAQE